MKMANLVCGIPLPRALGKYLERRNPVRSEPATGIRTRLHAAPPAGYIRAASRPVSRMNATTTNPTITPIIRLRKIESLREFAGAGGAGLTVPDYMNEAAND